MEALGREGKNEGQVMMIKNNDKVEAYQVCHPVASAWCLAGALRRWLTRAVVLCEQDVAADRSGGRRDRFRPKAAV
jgi:hypothetical protein